jgi:hypothetical protein
VRRARRALAIGSAVAGVYLVTAAVSGRLDPLDRRPLLDGFAPPPPYNWVSPPPDLASTNKPPSGGSFRIPLDPVTGSKANVFSTADNQLSIALPAGAIPARDGDDSVTLRMTPLAPASDATVPREFQIAGNVYRVEATYEPSGAPVPSLRTAGRLVMAYPLPLNQPVYKHVLLVSQDGTAFATQRGTDALTQQLIQATMRDLGYFCVGQAALATVTPSSSSGRRTLSIVVIVVGLVVLAVATAAEIRRRVRRG